MVVRSGQICAESFLILICAASFVSAQVLESPNAVVPTLRYSAVSGDKERFREDLWLREDWAGGLEELSFERRLRNDLSLSFDGRAIVPEEDYRFRLKVMRNDTGYFLAEYTEFRKYFDGTGGFYRPFEAPPFELGKDLRLDVGNILLEVGLAQEGIPGIAVRYEHKFREGNKSLLEWGRVVQGGIAKNIFPSFKDIDEETDILGLRVEHDVGKVRVGDDFHYEKHRSDTAGFDEERNLDTGAQKTVTVNENYKHDAFYNAFRLESFPAEKFYCSLGYLYSRLRGDAGLRINTVPFGPGPFDNNWFTRAVQVRHNSHVLNLNGMLGPYRDFVIYGGVKAETANSEGDTDAVLFQTAPQAGPVSPEALIVSNKDKDALEETLGIRYSGLKYTTIYAEGKWLQDKIDLFERELEDGALDFERLTETDRSGQRYTLGFSTSPVPGTVFSLRYRRSYTKNDYDHIVDSEPGYSAFITSQDFTKDELSARLTFRPLAWTHATVMYRFLSLDTDSGFDTEPPGSVRSGDYEANIYSVRIVVRPAPRFYFRSLFSYQDSKSTAFDNGSPSIVTYEGDTFSVLAAAGYSVDERTDLAMEYLFSRSGNAQENSSDGLSLGVDNRRHGLRLALSRNISDNAQARFQYGYYRYDDETSGSADDYRAHVFVFSLACSF
jgi:hypothetical protein